MGPLGVLSIVGRLWPRALSLVIVVGFVVFPHAANAALMWVVHVEVAHITSSLHHRLEGIWHHACHARTVGCRRQGQV
jgi:hypothetical protein